MQTRDHSQLIIIHSDGTPSLARVDQVGASLEFQKKKSSTYTRTGSWSSALLERSVIIRAIGNHTRTQIAPTDLISLSVSVEMHAATYRRRASDK